MYRFHLVCDCGYQTDDAYWGMRLVSGWRVIAKTIFIPSSGKLLSHEFVFDAEDPRDLDSLLEHDEYAEEIRNLYGDDAYVLIPSEYGVPILPCPKCRNHACRAVVTGVS